MATKKTTTKKSASTKTTEKKVTKTTKAKTKKTSASNAKKAAEKAMKDIIARARDHFRKASNDNVFILYDGRKLQDLLELAEVLDSIEDHVFYHHVNDERHDFANWVEHVLLENALAAQLRKAKRHPHEHQRIIYQHIVRRVW